MGPATRHATLVVLAGRMGFEDDADRDPRRVANVGAGIRKGRLDPSVSTVVDFQVLGVQTVEEPLDLPLGAEHVKGRMSPVLRDDLVFALRV